MSEPTTIELMRGSYELLNSMLVQNNWTSKFREITAGGMVSEKIDPYIEDRPVFIGTVQNGSPVDMVEWDKYQRILRDWNRTKFKMVLTNNEYQTLIVCIKHFADSMKIPSSVYAAYLLEAFKLTE